MKTIEQYKEVVIAIDHGNGNIKTTDDVFRAGVEEVMGEAIASRNILSYKGKQYVIGESHITFAEGKVQDENYFILTLYGIGSVLEKKGYTSANVVLSVGIPLAWFSAQRKEFRKYLMQDTDLEFEFHSKSYHVHISDVLVFPQTLAATYNMGDMSGENMILDIGNGTLSILKIVDGNPVENSIVTENYGVSFLVREIQSAVSKLAGRNVTEDRIEKILISGTVNSENQIQAIVSETVRKYIAEINRKLEVRGYDPSFVNLYVLGGGACIFENFGEVASRENIYINKDICANAKGYEYFAYKAMDARKKA